MDIVAGFDTSAYTTSLAAVDQEGRVVFDGRRPLPVPPGARGLRQSVAKELHQRHLPLLIGELFACVPPERLKAIAVSDRPRPVAGSYMPVFLAGVSAAARLAEELGIPLYRFSHQEGHIAAIRAFGPLADAADFLCYHLSGGTTELLEVRGGRIAILGGSRDLAAGQLLDRVGVALGMAFPAGPELDRHAANTGSPRTTAPMLTRIPVKDAWLHLSGIESQCQRRIADGAPGSLLISELFERLAEGLAKTIHAGCRQSGLDRVILAGGVSQSRTLRSLLVERCPGIHLYFGEYGADNGVGAAVLGGNALWHQNR